MRSSSTSETELKEKPLAMHIKVCKCVIMCNVTGYMNSVNRINSGNKYDMVILHNKVVLVNANELTCSMH